MSDSSAMATTDYSPGMPVAEEKGEKKAKNRVGSELAAVAEKDGPAAAKATAAGKKKWRVQRDLIDFILAWDVSDYVFSTPDNMDDDMPISDEDKAKYRAARKQAVAAMQQSGGTRCKMQEWVKAEFEKNGYVEIETTAEMLEKYQLEEYIDGQIV